MRCDGACCKAEDVRVDAGLTYLHYLPMQGRRPQSARRDDNERCDSTAGVMEPADTWQASVRHGWLALPRPRKLLGSIKAASRAPVRVPVPIYAPLSITTIDISTSSYKPPLAWRGQRQSADLASPDAESPGSPPRAETSWEVFDYLAGLDFNEGISLPELNQGKRLAKRLLRHSQSDHGQGLKVFYIQKDDAQLAACPPAAADPTKLIMHASLANSLFHHPLAADKTALKRAIFASKLLSRPGISPSPNAARVQAYTPEHIGGTRLVLHRTTRMARGGFYLTLEPSEHYRYDCHAGPLFERLAAFHANVLQLADNDAPIWPMTKSVAALAQRIEELRQHRSPYIAALGEYV